MKIQVISDIHLEFYGDQGEQYVASLDPTDVEILILAGDIGNSRTIQTNLRLLCERFKDATVIYVMGNHELYGGTPSEVIKVIREVEAEVSNLRFLSNQVVNVDCVRFGGTTLWFPDHPMNIAYEAMLNDFRMIEGFKPWVYEQHHQARAFLASEEAGQVDVMVTHHIPSERLIAPQYKGDVLNRFFVGSVDDLIANVRPKLWVFGHTHTPADEEIDGIRFLANPYGYPDEPKPQYQHKLLVEIS